MEEVDGVLSKKYDGDFSEYIRAVLDREKVGKVQIVSETDGPDGIGEFPEERCVWAFNTDGMMFPNWAKEKGARKIDEVLDAVNTQLNIAVKNGCSSLKNIFCWLRSLRIDVNVNESDANESYKRLLKAKPLIRARFRDRYSELPIEEQPAYLGFVKPPVYRDPIEKKSLEIYQDYLLKYVTCRAGELGLPYSFHTGGGQTPLYDLMNVNPSNLLPLLYDSEVRTAGTKIVVLHGGVPFIDVTAAMVSQFPNLYVDTSWPCQTNIIGSILQSNLDVNSPTKILYGTDCGSIAEMISHGAWNARRQLTRILERFNQIGWGEEECREVADLILNKNVKKLLNIK
jgi:hypothetical protein